jgi:hypothetical protein
VGLLAAANPDCQPQNELCPARWTGAGDRVSKFVGPAWTPVEPHCALRVTGAGNVRGEMKMSGVYAAVFIVGCAFNLLDCREIPVQNAMWTDMEDCNRRLEDAKRTVMMERQGQIIYGKCHYILVEDGQPRSHDLPMS